MVNMEIKFLTAELDLILPDERMVDLDALLEIIAKAVRERGGSVSRVEQKVVPW